MKEQTLRSPLSFAGIGLHTGAQADVEVAPAPLGYGIRFLRDGREIAAVAENVVETSRATVLGVGGTTISTVEHLLSALFGMGVSNARISISGPEVPVVDGSALWFAEQIAALGVSELPAERTVARLSEPIVERDGERLIVALPADRFSIRCVVDFPSPIGSQYLATLIDAERYARDIAGARTFGYLHEVEALRARGLAQGGSLENAVVFAPEGPLQPLRWPDEVVRHKTLDLLGDLALVGAWPCCEIVAIKTGHALHARLAARLRESVLLKSRTEVASA